MDADVAALFEDEMRGHLHAFQLAYDEYQSAQVSGIDLEAARTRLEEMKSNLENSKTCYISMFNALPVDLDALLNAALTVDVRAPVVSEPAVPVQAVPAPMRPLNPRPDVADRMMDTTNDDDARAKRLRLHEVDLTGSSYDAAQDDLVLVSSGSSSNSGTPLPPLQLPLMQQQQQQLQRLPSIRPSAVPMASGNQVPAVAGNPLDTVTIYVWGSRPQPMFFKWPRVRSDYSVF
jgi:outer membrane protein TolC